MYLTYYKPVKRGWLQKEAKYVGEKVTIEVDSLDLDKLKAKIPFSPADLTMTSISHATCLPENKADRYRTFSIPKKSGGMREIKEPVGDTKTAQACAVFLLQSCLKAHPHDCCHGFVKGRRCLSAMQRHQKNGSMWFLKLDIKNFFPSISKQMLIDMFNMVAQTNALSNEMKEQLADLFTDETDHLTQGCKSSPYLANMVLIDFDYKFNKWCLANNLTYTRYADDMCISSRVKFEPVEVVSKVRELLPDGIDLNLQKNKFTSFAQENIFLGLHYNRDKNITVGHDTKHLMKVIAHKAELGQIPEEEKLTWKGRLVYYTSIEPEYFKDSRFDAIRKWC